MKAYHVDSMCSIPKNQTSIDFQPIPSYWSNSRILSKRYPEGLSQWGINVLGLNQPAPINLLLWNNNKNEAAHNSYLIELLAEAERASDFPNHHSRFQSIFAVPTLELAKYWVNLFGNPDSRIYEIEFDEKQVNNYDYSFLNLKLNFFDYGDFQVRVNRYWSGHQTSLATNHELMIKLPVSITSVH